MRTDRNVTQKPIAAEDRRKHARFQRRKLIALGIYLLCGVAGIVFASAFNHAPVNRIAMLTLAGAFLLEAVFLWREARWSIWFGYALAIVVCGVAITFYAIERDFRVGVFWLLAVFVSTRNLVAFDKVYQIKCEEEELAALADD